MEKIFYLSYQLSSGELHTSTLRADRPLLVGRQSCCDIKLSLASVSRQHARFFFDGDSCWVEDLKSSNGTFVNKERIERAALAVNDLIQCGEFAMMLKAHSMSPGERIPNSEELSIEEQRRRESGHQLDHHEGPRGETQAEINVDAILENLQGSEETRVGLSSEDLIRQEAQLTARQSEATARPFHGELIAAPHGELITGASHFHFTNDGELDPSALLPPSDEQPSFPLSPPSPPGSEELERLRERVRDSERRRERAREERLEKVERGELNPRLHARRPEEPERTDDEACGVAAA